MADEQQVAPASGALAKTAERTNKGKAGKGRHSGIDFRSMMRFDPNFYGIVLAIAALGPPSSMRELYMHECVPNGADMNFFLDFDWKIKHSHPPTVQVLFLLWQSITRVFKKLFNGYKPKFTFLYDPGSFGVHIVFQSVRFVKHSDNPEFNLRLGKIVAEFSRLFTVEPSFHHTWQTDIKCTQQGTLRTPLTINPDSKSNKKTYYTIWNEDENNQRMSIGGRIDDPLFRLRCMRMGTIYATDDIGPFDYLCDLNATLLADQDPEDHSEDQVMVPLEPGENVSRGRLVSSFRQIDSALSAEARAFFLSNMGHDDDDKEVLSPFVWGHKGPRPVVDVAKLKGVIMYNLMMDKSIIAGGITPDDITRHVVGVMNEHYFYLLSNRPKIYMRKYDTANLTTTLTFCDPGHFKDICRNLIMKNVPVEITDKNGNTNRITRNFDCAKLWTEATCRRTYEALVFSPFPEGHPRAVHEGQLNTFSGWRWTPDELAAALLAASPSDVELADCLQDHIFNVLCAGDKQKFQFLLTLVAAKFRRPWMRPNSCACFLGHEGSGKTFFFEGVLFSMAGSYGAKCVNIDELFANFNTKYNDKTLLFFDEANYAGSHKNFAKLKNFITSDTMPTCAKYDEAREVPNYYACFMVTNQDRAVPLGTDARRFAIFEVAPNRARGRVMEHKAYFDRLYAITQSQGQCALMTWWSQFWDEELYPDALIDEFGQFGYNVFPSSIIGVLGKHKSNTLGSVVQFWRDVLRDGIHYNPHGDYLMNSLDEDVMTLDRIDFQVDRQTRDEEQGHALALHNQGRRLVDFSDNPLGAVTATLRDVWDHLRHPPYKADHGWLGFACVNQLWLEFESRRGRYRAEFQKPDLEDFISKTQDIFTHLDDDRSQVRVQVLSKWKTRAAARTDASLTNRAYVDMEADPDNYKHAAQFSGYEKFWRIGSLAFAKKQFYVTTGIDTTENQIHQQKDLRDSKENIVYSEDQFHKVVKYFIPQ